MLTLAVAAAVNWSTMEGSSRMTSTVASEEGWALCTGGEWEDDEDGRMMRRSLREESHVCVALPRDVGHAVAGMPIGIPSHGDLAIHGACTCGRVARGGVSGCRGGGWGWDCGNGGSEGASWGGDGEWKDGQKGKDGEEHDEGRKE